MQYSLSALFCALFVSFSLFPNHAFAVRFTNENWDTLPHPIVSEFSVREDGSAYGVTEDGRTFVQFNVPNDVSIRVQRFEIEDHYHYIVEGEIVNSSIELSALLALNAQL
jgi:hypothetical protein